MRNPLPALLKQTNGIENSLFIYKRLYITSDFHEPFR